MRKYVQLTEQEKEFVRTQSFTFTDERIAFELRRITGNLAIDSNTVTHCRKKLGLGRPRGRKRSNTQLF
jgi:hypothetical protein